MWKQKEPSQSVTPQVKRPASSSRSGRSGANHSVLVGKSVVVQGELHGDEDVTIEGQVEGTITLKQHVLTIGSHGRIQADVLAKAVVVMGEVIGDIEATEKVSINAEGRVDGDIRAPRVSIAEGAKFRGGIDMQAGRQARGTGDEPRPRPEPRRPVPTSRAN